MIGNTVGLLLILFGGYFLYKRRRLQTNETSIAHKGALVANTHAHQPSDPFTFPQTPTNPSPPTSHMTSPPHGIGSAPNTLVPTPHSSFRATSCRDHPVPDDWEYCGTTRPPDTDDLDMCMPSCFIYSTMLYVHVVLLLLSSLFRTPETTMRTWQKQFQVP